MKQAGVLLNVLRANDGNFCLETECSHLVTPLRDETDAYADAAQQSGVSITVAVANKVIDAWDWLGLEQIVDDLLSNVVKYSGFRPVKVAAVDQGGQARISVMDHGIGVPARERARVFSCFKRAVGRGERWSGFGLGL